MPSDLPIPIVSTPLANVINITFTRYFSDAAQFKIAFELAQRSNAKLSSGGTQPETVQTSSTDPAGPSSDTAKEVTDKKNEQLEEAQSGPAAGKEPTAGEETK